MCGYSRGPQGDGGLVKIEGVIEKTVIDIDNVERRNRRHLAVVELFGDEFIS